METLSLCHCDGAVYRKCACCQDVADRKEERTVCESWNWNYTPRECAADAVARGWSLRQLESAMKDFGYSPDLIAQVAYEFDIEIGN